MHPYYIQVWYSGLRRDGNTRWDHAGLPVSVNRQTANPNKVCRLTPIDMAKASTPPVGQWPAGWQLHTLTVKVLVLERAGEPLSVTTTGRRYWVRSLRVKVLRRATMPAVLSRNEKRCTFQYSSKKHEYRFHCECWYFWGIQSWITSEVTHVIWVRIQSTLSKRPKHLVESNFHFVCTIVNLENLLQFSVNLWDLIKALNKVFLGVTYALWHMEMFYYICSFLIHYSFPGCWLDCCASVANHHYTAPAYISNYKLFNTFKDPSAAQFNNALFV